VTTNPEVSTNNMKHRSLKQTISPNRGSNSRLQVVFIALLCAGVVYGCAQFRKVTYPDDYVYLDRTQLRSKMALFSLYMRQIDEVLLDDSITGGDQQQRIVELLNNINDLTVELGSGVTTNHLVIDDHIEQFKRDVSAAIRNARADPPNYFALGRLSGSCVACHQYRN
jgi:hypothetical protein